MEEFVKTRLGNMLRNLYFKIIVSLNNLLPRCELGHIHFHTLYRACWFTLPHFSCFQKSFVKYDMPSAIIEFILLPVLFYINLYTWLLHYLLILFT